MELYKFEEYDVLLLENYKEIHTKIAKIIRPNLTDEEIKNVVLKDW